MEVISILESNPFILSGSLVSAPIKMFLAPDNKLGEREDEKGEGQARGRDREERGRRRSERDGLREG